jgi:hypothetical protein
MAGSVELPIPSSLSHSSLHLILSFVFIKNGGFPGEVVPLPLSDRYTLLLL